MTLKKPTAKVKAGGKGGRKPGGPCTVPDCGRPNYAGGLCQTHHRQTLKTGKAGSIRPYRKRTEGTVKFSGLRLTPLCAAQILKYADMLGIARGAAIADILEDWHAKGKRAPRRDHA